jgi:hypothetical protein
MSDRRRVSHSALEALRKKHDLPDPTWTVPSVEGVYIRVRSVADTVRERMSLAARPAGAQPHVPPSPAVVPPANTQEDT